MQADAREQRTGPAPGLGGELLLGVGRGVNRTNCVIEPAYGSVAGRLHDVAAVPSDGGPQDAVMARQRFWHLGGVFLPQASRGDQIGEEEGECPVGLPAGLLGCS